MIKAAPRRFVNRYKWNLTKGEEYQRHSLHDTNNLPDSLLLSITDHPTHETRWLVNLRHSAAPFEIAHIRSDGEIDTTVTMGADDATNRETYIQLVKTALTTGIASHPQPRQLSEFLEAINLDIANKIKPQTRKTRS